MIRRYWLKFRRGIPVTFHLEHQYDVLWDRIYGVQVGFWFIGAVRSSDVLPVETEEP